jgi:hypothetical protein
MMRRPKAVIVVDRKAMALFRFAAEELQKSSNQIENFNSWSHGQSEPGRNWIVGGKSPVNRALETTNKLTLRS